MQYDGRRREMSDDSLNRINEQDRNSLKDAVRQLECAALLMKIASAVGAPIETIVESLPDKIRDVVQDATKRALERGLDIVTKSMSKEGSSGSLDALHKAACTASGALGGFFGLYALPIELPFSTAIMLRSIADIARSESENLDDIEARLACISVFAFGPNSKRDSEADIGYFAVRAALARALPNLADRALPPAFARFLTLIAERFGIVVSEKVVAEAVPIVGAVGGGTINYVFINHFQDIAHGHFTVRRLERKYGEDLVRQAYEEERKSLKC
jgi:hypothetical protein